MKKYELLFLGERGLNLIQEAIASGYSDILHILSNGNSKMVIDDKGRTIEDYVNMKGSPICPTFAAKELGWEGRDSISANLYDMNGEAIMRTIINDIYYVKIIFTILLQQNNFVSFLLKIHRNYLID